jgi:RNA polymerase primary sigma factor
MADMLASSSEYASDRKMDFDSLCTDLNQVLSCILNERERTIVVQSFGIGCPECSLDDIGYSMGLTRERVRQIRERGLEKIRKHPQSRLLLKHVA